LSVRLGIKYGKYPFTSSTASDASNVDENAPQYYYTGKWCLGRGSDGEPFFTYEWTMPRISDEILECSIFLYHSKEDAENDYNTGGSGFLVAIKTEQHECYYAVTNSHVILEGESPVVRINRKDGKIQILDIPPKTWIHHPLGDDVAICPLLMLHSPYNIRLIQSDLLITKQKMEELQLGIGDDIYIVGRLTGMNSKQQNTPAVRFGNIAVKGTVPMLHERGFSQESFVAEIHSISGFSGSPVFVHMLQDSTRPDGRKAADHIGPWLLGIDWGHIPMPMYIYRKNEEYPDNDYKASTTTGMATIVPAWKLQELLDMKEVVEMRKKLDDKIKKAKKEKRDYIVLDIHRHTEENIYRSRHY
jgi:hypothetical protein